MYKLPPELLSVVQELKAMKKNKHLLTQEEKESPDKEICGCMLLFVNMLLLLLLRKHSFKVNETGLSGIFQTFYVKFYVK